MNSDEAKELALLSFIDELCDKDYSSKNSNFQKSLNSLLQIYSHGYRHSYSSIFYKLQGIFYSSTDSETCDALGENLNSLNQYIKNQIRADPDNQALINSYKSFLKLLDHINLEIGRYNLIKQKFEKNLKCTETANDSNSCSSSQVTALEDKVKKYAEDLEKITPIVTAAKSDVDKIDTKLEENKLSSITALTIFSAVILAFSGGISFEASVFSNISVATPHRIVFIVSLTGFILFNTIFALLYIVSKMTKREISARCKYLRTDGTSLSLCRICGEGYCVKPCSSVSIPCKVARKYSYVLAINIILLVIMYEDYLVWSYLPEKEFFSYSALQMLGMGAPFVITILLFGIILWLKHIQRKRIILQLKCRIVNRYFEQPAVIANMVRVVSEISSAFLGKNSTKTDFITGIDNLMKESADFKKIDKYVENYVMTELLTDEYLANTITFSDHWRNKKSWEMLKDKLEQRCLSFTKS